MSSKEKLKDYQEKRDFRRTPEPAAGAGKAADRPIFVVQKHAARHLHYDFRLEVEGVLKSWAVPKGPSTDPKEKRLAVPTEDHPLEYADFEGVIPEGEYGAGTVLVWDTGPYRNLTEKKGKPVPMEEAVTHGHVKVWLEGKKLKGGYALTRFRTGKDEAWLLVKADDEEADARRNPVNTEPESVLSGRTIEDIEAAAKKGGY
ncbi:MAG: DNA polymerase ligase N-terminal domain-containing protein [Deltaproteobacteria bacterium]|nr:DNA polymerase ligase N-terminal domain-containing protein [Deltaproteobacteria bacterium]